MTAATGTPETTPTHQPELSDSERSSLSLGVAEQWRAAQKDELNDLRMNGDVFDGGYIDTFNENIDDHLDAYLGTKGVEPGTPHYDAVRQLLRDASIDRVNDEEWYARPSSRGEVVGPEDDHSGRDIFARRTNEYVATHTTTVTPESQEDIEAREDALAELKGQLLDARDHFSALAAKRQGSAIRGESEEYKVARDDYYAKMREFGKLSLKDTLEDDAVALGDKNVAVIGYCLEQETLLRNETMAKLNNTRIGNFVKFMNRGGLKMRIAKGVALGLIAGGVGALLVGATGAVAMTGIAAAASRFVRGYALHDKKREMGHLDHATTQQTITENITATPSDAEGDAFDVTEDHLRDRFEKDTKGQQYERRKALAWGLGSVAVGGVLGAAVVYGLDHGHSALDAITQNHGNGTPNQVPGGTHETPPAVSPKPNVPPAPAPSGREVLPTMPGTGEVAHHLLDRDASFTITPGEGLYETFQEMGIPQPMWHDVMNDVGPQLQQLGDTYWDPTHAEWRISHTGQFSDKAMKIMAAVATKHGYSLAA